MNTTDKNIPYHNLNPHVILNAIESAGFQCSGALTVLNSYENRVYQVGIENDAPLIAKFYRPFRWSDEAILEEHQFSLELSELEIPVIAPIIANNNKTLHHFETFRFALFPRRGGHALELNSLEQLEWMGRFLGRLHAVGTCVPFKYRPTLNVQTHGHHAFTFLTQNNFIPNEFVNDYSTVAQQLLTHIKNKFDTIPVNNIRLHGDCHAGNVLWNDHGPHIVDLDDCITGPAVQDIWMLLSGNTWQMETEIACIIRGYTEFHDFNPNELQLIESLRVLRMMQYAAWLAQRWEDPAFPKNFPWFNTLNYWREHIRDLREQLELIEHSSHEL